MTDVVVVGFEVEGLGLARGLARGLAVAAGRCTPVAAAGDETVTATATEVIAVTAASARRVEGEWRVLMPIALPSVTVDKHGHFPVLAAIGCSATLWRLERRCIHAGQVRNNPSTPCRASALHQCHQPTHPFR